MRTAQTIKAGKGRLARFAGRRVATFETPATRLVPFPSGDMLTGPVIWINGTTPARWVAAPAVTRAGIVRVGK